MDQSFSHRLLEQLFRRYRTKYLLVANSYVHNLEVAEDIVQDSFMALLEERDDHACITNGNIEAYLYGIIRNKCLMYRRNSLLKQNVYNQIKQKEQDMMSYYTRAIESYTPEVLLQEEVLRIYRQELEHLPELTRNIFLAQRQEGKSYKEIADQQHIPVKKVDKELQKVVSKLRRALKDFLIICMLVAPSTNDRFMAEFKSELHIQNVDHR